MDQAASELRQVSWPGEWGAGAAPAHDATGYGRSTALIRADIEATRARMDETLDAIEAKLTAENIRRQAVNFIKCTTREGAMKLLNTIKKHPLPAAVIGAGLTWLVVEVTRGSSRSEEFETIEGPDRCELPGTASAARGTTYEAGHRVGSAASEVSHRVSEYGERARERVGDVGHTVSEYGHQARQRISQAGQYARVKASELGRRVQDGAIQAKDRASTVFEDHPLTVGLATFAAGMAAGLSVPASRAEDRVLGRTRDRLRDQARDLGEEALQRGRRAAQSAAECATQAVREETSQGQSREGGPRSAAPPRGPAPQSAASAGPAGRQPPPQP